MIAALVSLSFSAIFAGACASLTYSAGRDVLVHRVDASTYMLLVLALIALVLGAAAAIDGLDRMDMLP